MLRYGNHVMKLFGVRTSPVSSQQSYEIKEVYSLAFEKKQFNTISNSILMDNNHNISNSYRF